MTSYKRAFVLGLAAVSMFVIANAAWGMIVAASGGASWPAMIFAPVIGVFAAGWVIVRLTD